MAVDSFLTNAGLGLWSWVLETLGQENIPKGGGCSPWASVTLGYGGIWAQLELCTPRQPPSRRQGSRHRWSERKRCVVEEKASGDTTLRRCLISDSSYNLYPRWPPVLHSGGGNKRILTCGVRVGDWGYGSN